MKARRQAGRTSALSTRSAPRGADAHTSVISRTGAGKPLSPTLRRLMTRAIGHDVSDVRVHEDGRAEALGALAFTRGSDVHFTRGAFRPDTAFGRRVLGHELVHVVQQREGRAGRTAGVNADPGLEGEADRGGDRAARGLGVPAGGDRHASPPGGGSPNASRGSVASGPVQCWLPRQRKSVKALPTAEDYRRARQERAVRLQRARRHEHFMRRRREAMHDIFLADRARERRDEVERMHERGQGAPGLQDDEHDLATYLVRRAADRRVIDGGELRTLRAANAIVNGTRRDLHHGRGNVRPDIAGSRGESTRRTETARRLFAEVRSREAAPPGARRQREREGQISAAAAVCLGAGNCSEHADVATHLLAREVGGVNGSAHAVESLDEDHAWSEWHGAGVAPEDQVILDAWAQGPAVLRADAGTPSGRRRTMYRYTGATAAAGWRAADDTVDRLRANRGAGAFVGRTLADLRRRNFRYDEGDLFNPEGVMSNAFLDRSAQRFNAARHPLGGGRRGRALMDINRQILTAGVARSLDENVRGAAAVANELRGRRLTGA